jgi:NADPH-dependent curcumin reductase CurA
MDLPAPSVEIHLASRPQGAPAPGDFAVERVTVGEPASGEVVVRNLYCSVDPYMRGRMSDRKSYVPPFRLGHVMDGGAIGEVVASASDALAPGDLVTSNLGWRQLAKGPAAAFTRQRRIDGVAPSAYLGALGMPGLTAYVGLLDIAAFLPGDRVFVSGAAGAVGSMVGQIAKLRGAGTVIGSAGSAAKVDWLRQAGFDAAFNYRDRPVAEQLAEAAGDPGIDVYFDNVGGDHLEAALGVLNVGGRVAMCGAISQYNATAPVPGPANLSLAVGKRLTLRGFIVSDHADRIGAFVDEIGPALAAGRIVAEETVVEGIEQMPRAMIDLLAGANTGKMLVRVG